MIPSALNEGQGLWDGHAIALPAMALRGGLLWTLLLQNQMVIQKPDKIIFIVHSFFIFLTSGAPELDAILQMWRCGLTSAEDRGLIT